MNPNKEFLKGTESQVRALYAKYTDDFRPSKKQKNNMKDIIEEIKVHIDREVERFLHSLTNGEFKSLDSDQSILERYKITTLGTKTPNSYGVSILIEGKPIQTLSFDFSSIISRDKKDK